jgi:hypothetical protein
MAFRCLYFAVWIQFLGLVFVDPSLGLMEMAPALTQPSGFQPSTPTLKHLVATKPNGIMSQNRVRQGQVVNTQAGAESEMPAMENASTTDLRVPRPIVNH